MAPTLSTPTHTVCRLRTHTLYREGDSKLETAYAQQRQTSHALRGSAVGFTPAPMRAEPHDSRASSSFRSSLRAPHVAGTAAVSQALRIKLGLGLGLGTAAVSQPLPSIAAEAHAAQGSAQSCSWRRREGCHAPDLPPLRCARSRCSPADVASESTDCQGACMRAMCVHAVPRPLSRAIPRTGSPAPRARPLPAATARGHGRA